MVRITTENRHTNPRFSKSDYTNPPYSVRTLPADSIPQTYSEHETSSNGWLARTFVLARKSIDDNGGLIVQRDRRTWVCSRPGHVLRTEVQSCVLEDDRN